MFLGRLRELDSLKKLHMRGGKKLVVLSGSAGVGKTELVSQLMRASRSLYLMPNGYGEQGILKSFWSQMISSGIGSKSNVPTSYAELLNVIKEESTSQGLILAIDSLQDIVSQSKKFMPAFILWWDSLPQTQNLTVIVLTSVPVIPGTAETRSDKSIYSRATDRIVLEGLTYAETLPILPGLTPEEAVEFYSVFGGSPHSLSHFNPSVQIERNIEENILDKSSFLYNFYKLAFLSGLRNRYKVFTILQSLGYGAKSLENLSTDTGIPKSELQQELRALDSKYGIIRRRSLLGSNPAISRNLFSIKDNFARFWFAFIYPNLGLLEQGKIGEAKNAIHLGLPRHISQAFCDICYEHLRENMVNNRENVLFYTWKTDSSSIDVVGLDRESLDAYFVDVHWSPAPLLKDSVESLINKASEIPWMKGKRKNHFIIYSKTGFRFETSDAQLINIQTLQRDLSLPLSVKIPK